MALHTIVRNANRETTTTRRETLGDFPTCVIESSDDFLMGVAYNNRADLVQVVLGVNKPGEDGLVFVVNTAEASYLAAALMLAVASAH